MKPLKRVVIKEELVELTGDYKKAIILNQFLYWSERVSDFDKFIKEEKERCINHGIDNNQNLTNGWIYKSSEELSEETMLGLSKSNIREHIKFLIEKGWLSERQNPVFKWDRTKQYRVNIVKIQKDLNELGYALEGYPLVEVNNEPPSSKTEHGENEQTKPSTKTEHGSHETEPQNFNSEHQSQQNRTAIPEITTEITTDMFSQSVSQQKDGPTDEEPNKKIYSILENIKSNYKENEQQLLVQALQELLFAERTIKNHDKQERLKNLLKIDTKIINYALDKFKKSCNKNIKNPQSYFTTILYNMIFECGAVSLQNEFSKQQPIQNKNNKNRFHNFEQRTDMYTPEQLKEIGRKNFERKLKELGLKLQGEV